MQKEYWVLRNSNEKIIDENRKGGYPTPMVIMDLAVYYKNGPGFSMYCTNEIKQNAMLETISQPYKNDKVFYGAIGTVYIPFMNKTWRVGIR